MPDRWVRDLAHIDGHIRILLRHWRWRETILVGVRRCMVPRAVVVRIPICEWLVGAVVGIMWVLSRVHGIRGRGTECLWWKTVWYMMRRVRGTMCVGMLLVVLGGMGLRSIIIRDLDGRGAIH